MKLKITLLSKEHDNAALQTENFILLETHLHHLFPWNKRCQHKSNVYKSAQTSRSPRTETIFRAQTVWPLCCLTVICLYASPANQGTLCTTPNTCPSYQQSQQIGLARINTHTHQHMNSSMSVFTSSLCDHAQTPTHTNSHSLASLAAQGIRTSMKVAGLKL